MYDFPNFNPSNFKANDPLGKVLELGDPISYTVILPNLEPIISDSELVIAAHVDHSKLILESYAMPENAKVSDYADIAKNDRWPSLTVEQGDDNPWFVVDKKDVPTVEKLEELLDYLNIKI